MNDNERGGRRRGGGIAVDGSGSVIIEPDMAALSVAVRWQDPSLETARSTVAVKASAARDHLLAAGVATADLQTSQLSVHTIRHRHDEPRPTAVGDSGNLTPLTDFVVATTMSALFREELSQAQVAVDGLFEVVGEGLELRGLSFDNSDRSAARVEARRLAFEDARAKAEQLADLAGAAIGPIRSIREGGAGHRPGPPLAAGRAMMSADASIPLEAGSLVEQVDLQIRWSLSEPQSFTGENDQD